MKEIRLIISFVVLATSLSAQNVGINTPNPTGKLHIKGSADVSQLIIDAHTTQSSTSPLLRLRNGIGKDLLWIHADDSTNVFMGLHAGRLNSANSGGLNNTFIGSHAGLSNTSGSFNTASGFGALFSNTWGLNNTALGSLSLFSNTSGASNTASGTYSLSSNDTGANNTTSGFGSMFSNVSGSNNTAIGNTALFNNISGSNNTAVGNASLNTLTSGNNNTALGHGANVAAANITNATAIGANAYAGSSNSVVIGSINGVNGATASANVGIGTTTPNAKLHVHGTVLISDGTQGAGKVLTSDADGIASWQSPPPTDTNLPTVSICCQHWMTKNLDVAVYRNGDAIPHVTNGTEWGALTTGAYCYYNNDSTTYAATYGKLYNWYAVNDPRGLAPEGWNIPTDFEWTTLSTCLGGNDLAGGLLKETGTTHWNSPNTGATNLSGFTGLPGGFRNEDGFFYAISFNCLWWSSSESGTISAWVRELVFSNDDLFRGVANKERGFSVRCIRD